MKYFFLLFVSIIFLASCEDTETNSPAFQGRLNNNLYTTIDAKATVLQDGSLIIQGTTAIEVLTLKLNTFSLGTYTLGPQLNNYATFEKLNTFFYNTNPNGDGEVVLNNIDTIGKTVSGTFRFNAIAAGIDTLNFQQGVFYQIPYDGSTIMDPNSQGSGSLTARLNGNIFNSFLVSTNIVAEALTITGTNAGKSIIINVPLNAVPSTNAIDSNGYSAAYQVGNTVENANSGSIIIFTNDSNLRRIKGTFSFETASNSIREGNFNVTY